MPDFQHYATFPLLRVRSSTEIEFYGRYVLLRASHATSLLVCIVVKTSSGRLRANSIALSSSLAGRRPASEPARELVR